MFGETEEKTKQEVICRETCHTFLYTNYNNSTLVDGKIQSDFLPFTTQLAESIGGEIYNHYKMNQENSSVSKEGLSIKEAMVPPETILSIKGKSGTKPLTYITGGNSKLRELVKKHLMIHGFQVREELGLQQQNEDEVSITLTEAQGQAFFKEKVNANSFSSLSTTAKTKTYSTYSKAVQDALHEYHAQKNVWIWNSREVTENTRQTMEKLSMQQVNNVYLHFNPGISNNHYARFIQAANTEGIHVHALMGDPLWGLKTYSDDAIARVKKVLAYNDSVAKNAAFIGVHFDVEPYVLPNWDEDRQDVLKQWSSSASKYINFAKENGLIVGSALPFWTDQEAVTDYYNHFYEEMIDKQDYVTLMAYRNSALGPNSIIPLTRSEIEYANSPKIEVGLELMPNDLDYVSFHNRSTLQLEKEMAIVRSYYASSDLKGFKGITLHDYDAWEKKPSIPMNQDTTAPKLQKVEINKKKVKPGEDVTISIHSHDGESGVDYVQLTIENSMSDRSIVKKVTDNKGKFNAHITINDNTAAGTWTLSAIKLVDHAGNINAAGYDQENMIDYEVTNGTSFSRIAGGNRYETSQAFTHKIPDHTLDSIILTDGNNYPDALAGGVLNNTLNGVIMLINDKQAIIHSQLKEAQRLLKPSGEIKVLGGEGAVSDNIYKQFQSLHYPINRIAGKNRVQTAINIAETVTTKPDGIFLVDGNDFADALSIVPYATKVQKPILLNTSSKALSPELQTYITNNPSISSITIIGGPNAVPSNAESQLHSLGIENVERISGSNRALTALEIAKSYYPQATSAGIANGTRFPDALSGSRYAYENNMPLLLTKQAHVQQEVLEYIEQIHSITLYGGEGVLDPSLQTILKP